MFLIQNVPMVQPKNRCLSRTIRATRRSRVSGFKSLERDTQRVSRICMGVPSLFQGAEGADGATEGVSTVAGTEGAASGAEGAVVAGMDGTTVTVGGDSG